LLGYHLDCTQYVDPALPFGCKSLPFLFNLFAEGFHWIIASFGIALSHYLKDFFGAHYQPQAVIALIQAVLDLLGIRLSPAKVIFGEELKILWILVNATSGIAYITDTRRSKILSSL
jgi:hypothetical protein